MRSFLASSLAFFLDDGPFFSLLALFCLVWAFSEEEGPAGVEAMKGVLDMKR